MNEYLDILERIEVQLKAVWWDNLMFFHLTLCTLFLFFCLYKQNGVGLIVFLAWSFIGVAIIQKYEAKEITLLKQYYSILKGGDNGKEIQTLKGREVYPLRKADKYDKR